MQLPAPDERVEGRKGVREQWRLLAREGLLEAIWNLHTCVSGVQHHATCDLQLEFRRNAPEGSILSRRTRDPRNRVCRSFLARTH
jgi:hypothetical protein